MGWARPAWPLQAAADLLEDFPDGVWFVDLSALDDPTLVPSAIASVLGVREEGSGLDGRALAACSAESGFCSSWTISSACSRRRPSSRVSSLRAPGAKVLVTSRTPLHASGEQEYPLPPLLLPDPAHLPSLEHVLQFEAVRLFVERAQAVKPDFTRDHCQRPRCGGDLPSARWPAAGHRTGRGPRQDAPTAGAAQAPGEALAAVDAEAPATSRRGSRRCVTRLPGVTISSPRRSRRSSAAWRSFPAAAPWRRRRRWPGRTERSMSSTAWPRSSTRACCVRRRARGRAALPHAGDGAGVRAGTVGGKRQRRGDPKPTRRLVPGIGGGGTARSHRREHATPLGGPPRRRTAQPARRRHLAARAWGGADCPAAPDSG